MAALLVLTVSVNLQQVAAARKPERYANFSELDAFRCCRRNAPDEVGIDHFSHVHYKVARNQSGEVL